MEPGTTEIMSERQHLLTQPTEKPSTTGFDNSSSPKTLRQRRKGKVWWALWEKVAIGKENKALKQLSKDNEHEYEPLSQMNDDYISSNETKMAMEPVKPESERLFIQPTEKPSTTGFDDPSSSSSSKALLPSREKEEWPLWFLWERIIQRTENKPLKTLSNDGEHEDEQLSPMDDEYISSNEKNMAMEPDTTEIKPESERLLIQSTENSSSTGFGDSKLPFPPRTSSLPRREGQGPPLAANRERAADGKKKMALKFPYKEEEDKDEQFRMDYGSFESDDDEPFESDDDEPLESDDEHSTQDGWVGHGDQTADLVFILRWARSYRVSIEVAGRMLKMSPEIVDRALKVHAQSTDPSAQEEVLLRTKPVVKNWWKLGPI